MFKVGDFVKVIDEKYEGKIISIDNDTVFVLFDNFEIPYSLSQLIKAESDNQITIEKDEIQKNKIQHLIEKQVEIESYQTNHKQLIPKQLFIKKNQFNLYEIDLHIEKLIDTYFHLTPHEIRTIQFDVFQDAIKIAKQQKIRQFVIIHGVGNQILKNDIRYFISKIKNIEFEDASYKLYGLGATKIILRNLHSLK